jgi:hypothetical protein
MVSISRIEGSSVYAYATPDRLEALRAHGYTFTVLPHPGVNLEATMARSVLELTTEWNTYPTYSQYVSLMESYAAAYPSLCRLETLSQTQEGREVLVLKITDHPDLEEAEPEVFYTSTMHGDETVGWILLLRLADELLSRYGTDAALTSLVDNLEIWINPLANPDGTYAKGDDTVKGAQRFLANGVDANRNFPDIQDGDHPDERAWAIETLGMMDFASAHDIVLSANFHGGAQVVNYPWDTWPRSCADEAWFIDLSHQYADQVQADGPRGYFNGFDDGITNGYEWYEVDGGRQDYMMAFHGGREVTIELSTVSNPPASKLPMYWQANRIALIEYLENAFEGIHGRVTDVQGQPVSAMIEVVGHDVDSTQVYTDPDVGDFYRFLEPGTWTLKVTANGYEPVTLEGVGVSDGEVTTLSVVLRPAA